MKILHACSELFPLVKTGGLADVLGALPWAQQQQGHDVRVVLPLYPQVTEQLDDLHLIEELDTFAGRVAVKYSEYQGMSLYLVEAPAYFARQGSPYHDEQYADYADNYLRFALLSFIASTLASGLDSWWGRADILHAHDWQTGLSCAYLKHWQSPVRSVFTVHNLAYQGMFAAHHIAEIDLPWSMFSVDGLEFQGQLSYLKAGLYYADHVTTVSPNYAAEITTEDYGCGLEGLLATRADENRLHGILNGIDGRIWNPSTDVFIAKDYQASNIRGKRVNKKALLNTFGLRYDEQILTAVMVARLTEQKGADIVLSALTQLTDLPVQVLILGSGAPSLEAGFLQAMRDNSKQVAVQIAYDEALAHQLVAGGDVILVPSRFEPCGLTQLYGLKYGNLPLVRRSGGLADTVVDTNEQTLKDGSATGFVFEEASAQAFIETLTRACAYWQQPRLWRTLIRQAMTQDFSWHKSALLYTTLYDSIM